MDIDAELDRWERDGERIATATIIAVRGSTPRSPGARLAFTASGRMTGSVSGGCVENDLVRRGRDVIESGLPVIASFAVGEPTDTGVALSCGGGIDVLIERHADDAVWRASRAALGRSVPVVRAVAVGPASLLGRRMLLGATETVGSIASKLDPVIVEEARALLRDVGEAGIRTITSGSDSASVFLEPVLPAPRLFVVGATDMGATLTTMAKLLGFRVVVIDAREAYVSRERFPDADDLVCAWPVEALNAARLDENSYVVALTHDPKLDVPALATALRSSARYIGALGSRRSHDRRKQSLRELGFEDADVARIHAPIGLDLGGRSPQEIALSVAAEMIANRYGRDSRAVKEDVTKGAA
jgi:xanthine dehydrogenase accessory factor